VVVEGLVTIEGAMDFGGLVGVRTCGTDVGVVERTGRCEIAVSIKIGLDDDLVGIYTGVTGSELVSVLSVWLRVRRSWGALWKLCVVKL
jgi:hypothetical protein